MTEQEVIKKLEFDNEKCYLQCEGCCSQVTENECTCEDSIIERMLDELMTYREIGTVEECQEAVSIVKKAERDELSTIIDEWIEYRKIGTVKECREAKDKTQPRKPIFKQGKSGTFIDYSDGHGEYKEEKWADWVCPECGWFVGEQYISRKHNQRKSNFCSRCGQAIDWSK